MQKTYSANIKLQDFRLNDINNLGLLLINVIMKNRILVIIIFVSISLTSFSQVNKSQFKRNVYEPLYLSENFSSKERSKIEKYFKKGDYDKAAKFSQKKEKKMGKKIFLILSENYYSKAVENYDNQNFLASTELFEESLIYLKKVSPKISGFIYKDIGECYISLYETDMVNENYLRKSYDNFLISNSTSSIDKYEKYYTMIFFNEYKSSGDEVFLEKAVNSCYNSPNSSKNTKNCLFIADFLTEKHKMNKKEKKYLEKSILLYEKIDAEDKLATAYESMAEYFIDYTNTPKVAHEYIMKINNVSEAKIKKYENLVNNKIVSGAESIQDCINLYHSDPALKLLASKKAFEMANSISDFKLIYDNFPTYVDEVEHKVVAIAGNDFSKLSEIYYNFNSISIVAEGHAYRLITSLESKKEFIRFFPDGIFSSQVENAIFLEERDIKNFESIVSKSVSNVSKKYYEMFDNYRVKRSNFDMASYKYEEDHVRLSAKIDLSFYVRFEDNDGENKLAGLFNIFSRASSRPGHTATIEYDILLYKDKPSKIVNYYETGIASLEGAQRGVNSLKGEFNEFLKSMAETSYDGSYDYYDESKNTPCYIILDDYGYWIDNTKRYYKIKCRDGEEWKITYNSESSEPYTKGNLDAIFFSYKTFQEAAKAACGCQ